MSKFPVSHSAAVTEGHYFNSRLSFSEFVQLVVFVEVRGEHHCVLAFIRKIPLSVFLFY